MREAILLYILRSPDERKRIHILMLPQCRIPSSVRHAKLGGYSIKRHQSYHMRKKEAT
jgi:dynein heavy chain